MNPRRLLPIFLIVLVDVFGLTLVYPLLPLYAKHFNATNLQATMLVSVYAACQLIAGPLLGRLSDRIGRKPVLLLSQLGTLLGFVVLAKATSLWMIYVARIIDGATAGNLSVAQAYIADNTPPKDRAKSFAIIGIAFGVGFFLGPALTGFLARTSQTAAIWVAAGMSFTSIIATSTLLRGGRPDRMRDAAGATISPGPGGTRLSIVDWGAYAKFFSRPVMGGLLTQFFFNALSFSYFMSGFTLFAANTFRWHGHPFGTTEVGYIFAYSGLLGILLQGGLVGRLVARFGEPALARTGFIASVVGYIALAFVRNVPELLLATTITAYGSGVLRPALTSLISQRGDRHEQGVVLGLTQSANSVASIVMPALSGAFLSASLLHYWPLVSAVASMAGLLVSRWGTSLIPFHAADAGTMNATASSHDVHDVSADPASHS